MEEKKTTILVVEDESLLLEAITKKLTVSNMTPVGFLSGEKALDYLKKTTILPDAIWLDYYLKDMSGLLFLMELKKKKEWERLPVIVVSNSATPDLVHNMLALGVKRYLLKADYSLEQLIEIIRGFIEENKKDINA